jgi:hypothetical protein
VILPPPSSVFITGYSVAQATSGNPVAIFGSGFSGVQSVRFNGVNPVAPSSFSATQILVTVPQGATTGPVTVTLAGGITVTGPTLTIAGFQFFPSFSDFSPNPVFEDNGNIAVFGNAFPVGMNALVKFPGNVSSTSFVTLPTIFNTALPQGAQTGRPTVRFGPAGTLVYTAPLLRIFSRTRAITGYDPNPAKRNRPLKITGGGFSQATMVAFQGLTGPVIAEGFTRDFFFPDNQISVNIPAQAFSNGRVRIFFSDGGFVDGPVLPIQSF